MIQLDELDALTIKAQGKRFADEKNKTMVLDIIAKHRISLARLAAALAETEQMATELKSLDEYLDRCEDLTP